jgi:hypothetical protein
MTTRAWLFGGAVTGALSLGAWSLAQAAPLPGGELPKPKPKPAPVKSVKLKNPAGTARAAAALARFANGQLGSGDYDRRVQAALGKLPGAKDTAKRLIAGLEAMSPAERASKFPGVKVETLSKTFDRLEFKKSLVKQAGQAAELAPTTTTLAPDPPDTKDKAQFELIYRGAKCDVTADPDGTDEPVVYFNVFDRKYDGLKWVFDPHVKYLPDAGTATATAGALTTAGAGQIWASPTWPTGYNNGLVFITAVLEDNNGDLAQRKAELDLLVQFAISETEEDTVTQDRMEALRRELEDTLVLLHLANPDRWSARAIQVKKLTGADYDALYLQPATASPVPHKLTFQHDPRGAAYTLYFDIPTPQVTYKTVYVKVKEVEALGSQRDAGENKIADLGVSVAISGNTSANATRAFATDKNLVKPGWTIERDIQAGSTVSIGLAAFDEDPAPDCGCLWGTLGFNCHTYCANPDKQNACGVFSSDILNTSPGMNYGGPCPKGQIDYDINPALKVEGWGGYANTALRFTFDTATNKLTGDVTGAAGTFTVTGDAAGTRARIVFEVGVKRADLRASSLRGRRRRLRLLGLLHRRVALELAAAGVGVEVQHHVDRRDQQDQQHAEDLERHRQRDQVLAAQPLAAADLLRDLLVEVGRGLHLGQALDQLEHVLQRAELLLRLGRPGEQILELALLLGADLRVEVGAHELFRVFFLGRGHGESSQTEVSAGRAPGAP